MSSQETRSERMRRIMPMTRHWKITRASKGLAEAAMLPVTLGNITQEAAVKAVNDGYTIFGEIQKASIETYKSCPMTRSLCMSL